MTDTVHATVDAERTLGDLVAERPARARVLEAAGLDYCCHGRRTLRAACEAAGIDAATVAADLAAVTDAGPAAVDALAPAELVDHIETTHHAYLHDELPALHALATKVAGVHGTRHPELADVERLVAGLRAELEPHLRREERVLFPATRDQWTDGLDGEIAVLVAEHEACGALLAELRSTTADYAVPDDACASYTSLYLRLAGLEADTFRHIHLENNVLFPALVP